ncbi:hypothetical protein COMNV_00087 [Commensalibacter sp. Nvir]|uniref:hypothetical protein n=1 Tax=Commensalibacter sp. Nvir TaxID=3069817 RepID=UPI002D4828D5|nr:hypothetical protein COMNV_00087 [Commensalibacter sp. Nvir]
MKITTLGKTIADAEVLLLKKRSARVVKQLILCAIGALCGLFTLISLHAVLAALCWDLFHFGVLGVSLILFAFDIFLMALFFLLAVRQRVSVEEIEAKVIRNHSLKELRNSLALTALLGAFGGPLGNVIRQHGWKFIRNVFKRN